VDSKETLFPCNSSFYFIRKCAEKSLVLFRAAPAENQVADRSNKSGRPQSDARNLIGIDMAVSTDSTEGTEKNKQRAQ
jgi:hypothetical protein